MQMFAVMAVAVSPVLAAGTAGVNPSELIARSIQVTEANWKAAPNYSLLVTRARKSDDSTLSKTQRVVMIEGSPYQMLLAENGQSLSPARHKQEEQRLRREIRKRGEESVRERRRRMADYQEDRERDHMLLSELGTALNYSLQGEQTIDGHPAWLIEGTSRPDYVPPDRMLRILTAIRVQIWIDKASLQWVRVTGEVVHPVPFYGIIAKVEPGTSFELRQAPVGGGLWMPTDFTVHAKAVILGLVNRDFTEETKYADYRDMREFAGGPEAFNPAWLEPLNGEIE